MSIWHENWEQDKRQHRQRHRVKQVLGGLLVRIRRGEESWTAERLRRVFGVIRGNWGWLQAEMAYLARKRDGKQRTAQVATVALHVMQRVLKQLGVSHERLLLTAWQRHAAGYWLHREAERRLVRRSTLLVDLSGLLRRCEGETWATLYRVEVWRRRHLLERGDKEIAAMKAKELAVVSEIASRQHSTAGKHVAACIMAIIRGHEEAERHEFRMLLRGWSASAVAAAWAWQKS